MVKELICLSLFWLSFISAASALPLDAHRKLLTVDDAIPGQYIVAFSGQKTELNGTVLYDFDPAVQALAMELDDDQLFSVLEDPNVVSVQEDAAMHLDSNWGIDRIDQKVRQRNYWLFMVASFSLISPSSRSVSSP
jgi:hypothetical protein